MSTHYILTKRDAGIHRLIALGASTRLTEEDELPSPERQMVRMIAKVLGSGSATQTNYRGREELGEAPSKAILKAL